MSTEAGFDLSELEDVNREIIDLVDRKYPKAAKSLMNKQANSFRRRLRAAYRKETKKHTGNLLKGVSKSKVSSSMGPRPVRLSGSCATAWASLLGRCRTCRRKSRTCTMIL